MQIAIYKYKQNHLDYIASNRVRTASQEMPKIEFFCKLYSWYL